MDIKKEAIKLHKENKGKIALLVKTPINSREDLSKAYTPGVGAVCMEIAKDKEKVWELTSRGNWVAVVTDGTAVLGLGDIGPEAALPVMEGKAVLFKEFGGVDAFPICLDTKDPEEIINIVKKIAPTFGGINLEDIAAPRCFYIKERLINELDIPVFHDDQDGTAIVVLAGLINAAKVVNKPLESLKVVVNGAGAAGLSITKLLLLKGIKDIIVLDSKGIICQSREDLNEAKKEIAVACNINLEGRLSEAIKGRDVFIGVSVANVVNREMVASMASDAIVFAMANPDPEILPDEAYAGGAKVVATGRSDFANQVNNVLIFPGLFKGILEARVKIISDEMKLAAAYALADYIKEPKVDEILPSVLDKNVAHVIAEAVKMAI